MEFVKFYSVKQPQGPLILPGKKTTILEIEILLTSIAIITQKFYLNQETGISFNRQANIDKISSQLGLLHQLELIWN